MKQFINKAGTIFYVTSLLSLLLSVGLLAQTPGPPSLAIGAGKVLYDKGSLDAELISTIIATKQDEVKNELASRLILSKLENESYVIRNFAETNINLLLKEKNLQVIKKELLRNASELMITSATLEFYLRAHRKTEQGNPFTKIIGDVIDSFNESVEAPITPQISSKGLLKGYRDYRKLKILCEKVELPFDRGKLRSMRIKQDALKFNASVRDAVKKENQKKNSLFSDGMQPGGKFLPKPSYLFGFDKLKFIRIDDKELYLQNILLDLTYGVLTKNEFIQQLGLFSNVETGQNRNKFDNFLFFCSNIDTVSHTDIKELLYRDLKNFEKCLATDLAFLTKYQFILSQTSSSMLRDGTNVADSISLNNTISSLLAEIKSTLVSQKVSESFCKSCDKSVFGGLLSLTDSDIKTNSRNDDSWLYTVQIKLLPLLFDFSVTNNSSQAILIQKLDNFQAALKKRLISNLLKDMESLPARRQGSDILFSQEDVKATLLKLISLTVNNFDHAETYDIIMNFISGFGALSADPVAKKITGKIIDAGEKYITIQKDSNKVSLDVESMAVDIYKQFSENSNRRFSMYFSVGLNYNTPIGEQISIDSTSVKSYAFLSEKIGFKYNVFDFSRRYGFFKAKQKPIIKDFHTILFGSGLLYQIKELSTAKNFFSPIVGAGLGVSFFNDLDLNINYAFPIDQNTNNGLLNISFDIKITEYLSALSKAKKLKNK
jgi:hypothetical protein